MAVSNFQHGDTQVYNLTFSKSGAPYDITGHTIYMTFKTDTSLADNAGAPDVIQATGVIQDGPNGTATVTLPSTLTKTMTRGAKYFYDVQIHDGGTPTVVSTIESGTITVATDVTWTDGNA